MRNWRPYIPDVVRQMRADGVEEAAVICLAPQNSRTSVGLYERAVKAEAGTLRIDFTRGWARHPLLADAFAERLRAAEAKLNAETGAPVPVLFTAHSVPTRTIEPQTESEGQPRQWPGGSPDPYADEARHTAELVAERSPKFRAGGLPSKARARAVAPGSAPPSKRPSIRSPPRASKTLLLQPIGFLCDHVEILYDVDIAFRKYAAKIGIRLERPESLNASPTLAKAVADLAIQGLHRLQS